MIAAVDPGVTFQPTPGTVSNIAGKGAVVALDEALLSDVAALLSEAAALVSESAALLSDVAALVADVVADAASTINAHFALSVFVVSGWEPEDWCAVIAIKILFVLVSFTISLSL